MAKYKVQVGGFVSTYRKRTYEIYAKDEESAKEKAEMQFIDDQQSSKPGNMCDEGTINYIEKIEQ